MTAVLTEPKTQVLIEEHIILRGVSWKIYKALMKEHESRSAPRFTHVQDNEIVKVTSPADHSVTSGHLCIKGRFGFSFAQKR